MTETVVECLPLADAQWGVWIGQQLTPANTLFNAAESVDIHGQLDVDRFGAALRLAVAEADTLHTRFVSAPPEVGRSADVTQLLSRPDPDWSLPFFDLSGEPHPRRVAHEWMRSDLATSVDLRTGPLFRHALFNLGAQRHLWYHRAHHICLDGYGFALFARRVAELYNARDGYRTAGPGFGRLRVAVDADAAYRRSAQFDADRRFWRSYLADLPAVASLGRRPAASCGRLLRRGTVLPSSTMPTLRGMADRAGATWVEVVLALAAGYVGRHAGADEVILGVPAMGRLGSAAATIPAMVMNIVPLRVPVRPAASLLDTVGIVAAGLRTVRPHQRYRAERIRRDLGLVGGDRRLFGPVVNVMPFDCRLDFGGARGFSRNLSAGAGFLEDIAVYLHVRHDGTPPILEIDAHPEVYGDAEVIGHLQTLSRLLVSGDVSSVRRTGHSGRITTGPGRGKDTPCQE